LRMITPFEDDSLLEANSPARLIPPPLDYDDK